MFAGCSSCSSHLIPLLLSHIRLLHPLRDNGNGLECLSLNFHFGSPKAPNGLYDVDALSLETMNAK